MRKLFFSIACCITLSIPSAYAELKPAEARQLAKDAYIFSYPLIMNYRMMYIQAIDNSSSSYTGGFGKIKSLKYASPENKDVVTPNVDTPYSWAWVDLRSEPWVITMPAIDSKRYYSSQWDDLWGFVLDSPGSINDGNDGDSYLLTDTNWKGTVPPGINRVIKGESAFLGGLMRTEFYGGDDINNVNLIQAHYELMPLSMFMKQKSAPPAAPLINWLVWHDGSQQTLDAFKYVNFLLPYTYPNKDDKIVLDSIKKIGIESGKPWEPSKLSPAIQEALKQGVNDAIQLLSETAHTVESTKSLFGTREALKDRYLDRAVGVYAGMFGNTVDQAIYLPWSVDKKGEELDGSKHNYTITFPKGSEPPADYFWSITMYSLPDHYLVANAIKRYAIGSRTKGMTLSADGGLTIYIQHTSPGKDKETNWLPSPKSPFYLILRTYGPGAAVQEGKWKQPQINSFELPPPPKVATKPAIKKVEEDDHEQVKVDEPQQIDGEYANDSEPVSSEPSAELANPDMPYPEGEHADVKVAH